MAENRVLPRYRGEISAADKARARVLADEAASLQEWIERGGLVADRNRLLSEANLAGLSQPELAAILGKPRTQINAMIQEHRRSLAG